MAYVYDADKVSSLATELLARSIVLPATVARIPRGDYQGSGGTVKVRVPVRRTALQQATPGASITYTAVSENEVDVAVTHWYDAVTITDEDLTLKIEDFSRQVLLPMVTSVAEAGENRLAAVMNVEAIALATSANADDIIDTATPHGFVAGDKVRFSTLTGGTGLAAGTAYYVISANLAAQTFQVSATPGGSAVNFTTDITAGTVAKFRVVSLLASETVDDTKAKLITAREYLTAQNVPMGRRYLAVSPSLASRLFKVPEFVRVDESGSPSALRDAILGRVYGMTVVESNALDANEGLAYHESAFAFATLAPAIPQGAGSAAAAVAQGIALRTVFDYDPGVLSDVVAVSTFGGASLVDGDRVVKLNVA